MKYPNTKMAHNELDFFVKKFNQLWKDGLGAHLDIDTHAGQAWVGVRVRLGHVDSPHQVHAQVHKQKSRNSPSRQRRRARREAAKRQKEAEEANNDALNEAGEASEEEMVNISEHGDDFDLTQNENSAEIADYHNEDSIDDSIQEETVPCENCTNEFDFYKDINDNMCDTCIVRRSEKSNFIIYFPQRSAKVAVVGA
jgi:hypothetical protein